MALPLITMFAVLTNDITSAAIIGIIKRIDRLSKTYKLGILIKQEGSLAFSGTALFFGIAILIASAAVGRIISRINIITETIDIQPEIIGSAVTFFASFAFCTDDAAGTAI